MQIVAPDLGIRNRSDIKLLLQGDGADQSTIFMDSSRGNSIIRPGCKGVGWSDGSAGNNLTLAPSNDFNFGAGNFGLHFWLNPTVITSGGICGNKIDNSNYWGLWWENSTPVLRFYAMVGGVVKADYRSATIPTINKWQHIYVGRNGSAFLMEKDGSPLTLTESVAIGSNDITVAASGLTLWYEPWVTQYRLNGFLSDFHVLKGAAPWAGAFTPPQHGDPVYSHANTVLLLEFNNVRSDTCTTFVDTSAGAKTVTRNGSIIRQTAGNPITRVGDTKIVNQDLRHPYARSAAFYPGSSKLSCADNADLRLGNQDFVIEGWINQAQTISSPIICAKASSGLLSYAFAKYDATYMAFLWSTDGTTWGQYVTFPWQPTVGKHQFIALSRSGNVLRFYAEGDKKGADQACSATFLANAGAFDVGKYWTSSFSDFIGSMIDFRVSVGTDRGYTGATIPVPTTPLPSDSYTKLLIRGDNVTQPSVFVDKSPSPKTITVTGNAQTVPLPPGASAIYMDGSGDCLTTPANVDCDFGTGDFAIHFWVNLPSIPSTAYFFDCYNPTSGYRYTLSISASGISFYASAGVTTNATWTPNPIINTTTHIALQRSSGVLSLRLNGISSSLSSGSAISSTNIVISAPLVVGARYDGAAYNMAGYIRGLTVARRALWNRDFTVPNRLA